MRPHDAPMRVLLYSDDARTRASVKVAVGRRPAPDVPRVEWVECATEPAVIRALDKGGIDLVLLDGEASPAGGMGICRQIKDEIFQCPPVVVLIGRADDRWLATWSRADAVIAYPLDPIRVASSVAEMLRRRERATPAS
jgi:DNA-binding response OmpR family regulator